MPKNLVESLALVVPLILLFLYVILMIASLRLKLPILPLDSRLQLNHIGSKAAKHLRWLSFSSKDPPSSGAIRSMLLRPIAFLAPQPSLPCAFLLQTAAPSATLYRTFGFVFSCNLCFDRMRSGGRDGQCVGWLEIPWDMADFDTDQARRTLIPRFRPAHGPPRYTHGQTESGARADASEERLIWAVGVSEQEIQEPIMNWRRGEGEKVQKE
jgi:hypothetical protein